MDLGDYIAVATAYSNIGDKSNAEIILNNSTQIPWPNVTLGQTVLLYRLLETIKDESGLEMIPEEYV